MGHHMIFLSVSEPEIPKKVKPTKKGISAELCL